MSLSENILKLLSPRGSSICGSIRKDINIQELMDLVLEARELEKDKELLRSAAAKAVYALANEQYTKAKNVLDEAFTILEGG